MDKQIILPLGLRRPPPINGGAQIFKAIDPTSLLFFPVPMLLQLISNLVPIL